MAEAVREHEIEWSDAQVARLWDYYARTPPYSEMYFARQFGHRLLLGSRLPLDQSMEILDFGSGPGFMWDHLRALGSRCGYTALDFSAESVSALQQRAGADPLFRGAIHASKLPSPLADASFDAVLLIEVVEHLKDAYLHDTFREVSRLLKPGGTLVISTPNQEDLSLSRKFCPSCGAVFHEWQHVRSWSFSALEHCMAAYGFTAAHHLATNFQAHRKTGVRAWVASAKAAVKRARGKNPPAPHLLAVFRKQ